MQMISIGKLAHILNIEKKQVRMWAREFNINNLAEKTENQIRQADFSPADLVTFKLIKKLIFQENYSLEQVKNYFSAAPDTNPTLQDTETSSSYDQKYGQKAAIALSQEETPRLNMTTVSHPLILSLSKDPAGDHPLSEIFDSMQHVSQRLPESPEITISQHDSPPGISTEHYLSSEYDGVLQDLNPEISLARGHVPPDLRSQLLDLHKKLLQLRELL